MSNALEKDARRYRAIRSMLNGSKWEDLPACLEGLRPEEEKYVGSAALDEAIDAAFPGKAESK